MRAGLLLFGALFCSMFAKAQMVEPEGFRQALGVFAQQVAQKYKLPAAEVERQVAQVRYQVFSVQAYTPVINADKNIEVASWENYRRRMVDDDRIQRGQEFFRRHRNTLLVAEQKYGVPAAVIAAIIGVETRYGRVQGKTRVLDALLTLAIDYPATHNQAYRKTFFRAEAEALLVLAKQHNRDPLSYFGSFAGAIGIPQFMPTSILKHAVDFDNDNKIDLQNSPEDAIGSVANYLSNYAWLSDKPLQKFAIVAEGNGVTDILDSLEAKSFKDIPMLSLQQFSANGINFILPASNGDDLYAIISVPTDNMQRAYFLANTNFFVVTRYNLSYRYGLAVSMLAQRIAQIA